MIARVTHTAPSALGLREGHYLVLTTSASVTQRASVLSAPRISSVSVASGSEPWASWIARFLIRFTQPIAYCPAPSCAFFQAKEWASSTGGCKSAQHRRCGLSGSRGACGAVYHLTPPPSLWLSHLCCYHDHHGVQLYRFRANLHNDVPVHGLHGEPDHVCTID